MLGPHVARAGNVAQHTDHFVRVLAQQREILPIEVNGQIALDSGEQIVRVHLDGLRITEARTGHLFGDLLVERFDQPLAVVRGHPLFAWLQHDVHVGHVDAHRIDGDLGATGAAHDAGDFGERQQGLLEPSRLGERLLQGNAGQAHHGEHVGAFVELRQKLFAHSGAHGERGREDAHRESAHRLREAHGSRERRRIDALDQAEERALLVVGVAREHPRRKSWDERDREDERRPEREEHGERHGPEHPTFGATQRHDGHVHERDDGFAEGRGGAHLDGRFGNALFSFFVGQRATELFAFLREPADRVLDDDDGAVDHEAEVDGP